MKLYMVTVASRYSVGELRRVVSAETPAKAVDLAKQEHDDAPQYLTAKWSCLGSTDKFTKSKVLDWP